MSETTTPELAKQRIPAKYWKIAALSGMASYLDSGLIISVSVSLAIWATSFDLSVWMLGSLSAILTVCIAVGSLVGGRLADLFGRRLVYGIDILVYAIGAAMIMLAPNSTVLFIGVIIAGLAAGADLPTSLAVVSDSVPVWARGRLIAFTQVMWTIGIAVTIALSLAVSTMGQLGTRIIVGHLVVAALVTWVLRSRLKIGQETDALEEAGDVDAATTTISISNGTSLRNLLDRRVLIPMLATFAFYVFWGLGANTFGQFGTYFLVTVSGASQTTATFLSFVFIPVGIVTALLFVRISDTKWRDRVFIVAGLLQVLAFAIGAVTGGAALMAMVLFMIVYNLSNSFAGEGNYKVWSQMLLPGDVRGTAQGITYAVARGVFAAAAFVTPALLAFSPTLLLWSLVVLMVLSWLVGLFITRRLIPVAPAVVGLREGLAVDATQS
ncbi:MFS transporter [Microbacterium profundi]|uniref:MFS transporter n=1 Tax=Microbacterium profundi TaxID=450380 RepID=UPI001F3317FA|nr:MFS transporter [Microbacterium profundi]MCE7483009.1 MFS transporter [Microbacterium profundi]